MVRSSIEGSADIRGGLRHHRPQIDEDAVAEFGAILGVGIVTARNLIGDAVNLRWRYPNLWRLIQAAGVPAWQARKVAEQTTFLSWEQSVELDTRLAR